MLPSGQRDLLQFYLPDFEFLLCDLSAWRPTVEPPLAIQVFVEAPRSACGGDPDRTRRLLGLAARLYGERNGARIVHAVLTYLFGITRFRRLGLVYRSESELLAGDG